MSQSANDWASTNPGQNMTLAEADQLGNQLAGALTIQFGTRFVRTQSGNIISEAELRSNNYLSPLAVNLCGYLAFYQAPEINIAEFRTSLRNAAAASDPTGTLVGVLQQALPGGMNVASMFTRIPAIQAVIATALKQF